MFKHLLISSLLCLATVSASAADKLDVIDPWVREAPPNASVIGAFMKLHNPADHAVVVKGVSSPVAGSMQIHRTIMEGGMARMVQQEELIVPAHGEVALQPGGFHLMLFGLQHVPVKGEKVEISLTFADGSVQQVTAVTRPFQGQMHMHDGQGQMPMPMPMHPPQ